MCRIKDDVELEAMIHALAAQIYKLEVVVSLHEKHRIDPSISYKKLCDNVRKMCEAYYDFRRFGGKAAMADDGQTDEEWRKEWREILQSDRTLAKEYPDAFRN